MHQLDVQWQLFKLAKADNMDKETIIVKAFNRPSLEEMQARQAETREWLIEEGYTPQSLWPQWYPPGTPRPE